MHTEYCILGDAIGAETTDARRINELQVARNVRLPQQWINADVREFDFRVLHNTVDVVMADPPWDIHMELPYAVLTDSEMKNLRFQDIHDNGMIFLWVTGRAAELARDCMKTWGYRRVEEIVWVKTNQLQRIIRTGRTGHWLNHSKEHCIVGVKGNPRGMNRNIDCDVIVSEVRETSRKPDEIYNLIERMFPNSLKVEIFGRPHNLSRNWVTIGNQLRGVHLCTEEILERYNATLPPNATPILPFDPNKPEIDPNEIMNPEMVCDPVPEDEAVSAKAGGGMLALEGPGGDHAAAKPTDNAPIAVGAPTPAGAVWQPPASTSSSAAVTMAAPLVMPAGILPPPGKQGSPTLVAGNVTNPAAGGLKSVDHSKSTGKSPSAKRRKVQSPSKLNPTSEHHTERTSKSRASSKSEDSDGGVGFKMPSASALLGDTNKDSSTTNAAGSIAAANAAWGAVAGASTTTSTTKSAWGALPAGSASGAAATTTTAASSGWGGTGTVVSSGWGGTGTSSVSSGWNTVSTTPTIPGAAAVQAASAAAAGGQASTANSSGMPPPTAPTTQHTITHKGQQLPIGHRMPGVPGATPTNAKGTAGKLPVSWGAVIPGGTPTNADGVATGTADQQRQTPTANTWAAFNKPGAAGAAVGTGPAPTPGTWGAVTAAANAAAAGGGGGSSTAAPQQWGAPPAAAATQQQQQYQAVSNPAAQTAAAWGKPVQHQQQPPQPGQWGAAAAPAAAGGAAHAAPAASWQPAAGAGQWQQQQQGGGGWGAATAGGGAATGGGGGKQGGHNPNAIPLGQQPGGAAQSWGKGAVENNAPGGERTRSNDWYGRDRNKGGHRGGHKGGDRGGYGRGGW